MAVLPAPVENAFQVGILTQGRWGERIADNIEAHCPEGWTVWRWQAPARLPLIVDDGLDYLPAQLPPADLVISLGDTAGVAQLLPDAVRLTGARAVIAPIDRHESLPTGLARQVRGWLADLGVSVVFPKPFCSLTETSYNLPPIVEHYDDALIRRFAQTFGRPALSLNVVDGRIGPGRVQRDSACGCARYVVDHLAGCPVDEAEYTAGMLHHHFPCLAGMNTDPDYRDTLMHVSGHVLRDAVHEQIAGDLAPVAYLRPQGRAESPPPPDRTAAP
jgi:hypothetical protein